MPVPIRSGLEERAGERRSFFVRTRILLIIPLRISSPGGTIDNSPAIYRWDTQFPEKVPPGTEEGNFCNGTGPSTHSFVPAGTPHPTMALPTDKSVGYFLSPSGLGPFHRKQ